MVSVPEPKVLMVGSSWATDITGKTGTNACVSSRLLVC